MSRTRSPLAGRYAMKPDRTGQLCVAFADQAKPLGDDGFFFVVQIGRLSTKRQRPDRGVHQHHYGTLFRRSFA